MSVTHIYPVLDPQVVTRQVEDVLVVLLPESGEVKVLNEVGARILQCVDGLTPVDEIAARIAAEFQVSMQQAEEDTLAFLRELEACRVLRLKIGGEPPAQEQGHP